MKNEKQYFQISSLEKGIKVLELLADKQSLSVAQVAEHLGFNRTGSHRYLSTLRALGYVEQDENARYALSFKVLELATGFLNRFEIRRIIRPYLQEISSQFNETVNFCFWEGEAVRLLDKIDSPKVLRTDPVIGTRMPAHCSSAGKSILAFLPPNELDAFMDACTFEVFTPNTISQREALEEELRITRARGYALDNEEWLRGIQCVAAPIFDYTGRPAYAISVPAPSFRMTPEVTEQVQAKVREICSTISQNLGAKAQIRA